MWNFTRSLLIDVMKRLSARESVMSENKQSRHIFGALILAGVLTVPAMPAFAQALSYGAAPQYPQVLPQYAPQTDEQNDAATDELPAPLRRQVVSYSTSEPPGTIVVDTPHTFLYLTLGNGKALRYGIGVGRQGFTWAGTQTIVRKAEWPDWIPPAEMIARQPYLPRWVGGGPGNPLGARALYLGNTDYRIHGTNDPTTIGKHVSSGCIRLQNADVIDLFQRVGVGTKVVVLPNDQLHAVNEDRRRVAIDVSSSGPMKARIAVLPATYQEPAAATLAAR
jgi:lipoprotein-anchoring transpeptidase ErfK/SrfK